MKFLIFAVIIFGAHASVKVSKDDALLIQATWNQVKHNDVDILFTAFSEYSDTQALINLIPDLAGQNLNTLKSKPVFALFASRLISTISDFVNLLGNDANEAAIKKLGNQLGQTLKNHKVLKKHLNEFRRTLINYVKVKTSECARNGNARLLFDNIEGGWNQAADYVYEIIFSNLDGHPVDR